MNPELNQHQSDVESPAKRQKMNDLINFWGGGANMKRQFKNNPASLNFNWRNGNEDKVKIQNTETHPWQRSYSGNNPGGGGGSEKTVKVDNPS